MDEKGRLKIPAGFKRYLEEKYQSGDFYVTSLTGENVWIYPMKEWEAIENKLASMPSTLSARQKYLDRVSYYGQTQQMDAQGRILIHQLLRGAAELIGDVTVMGKVEYLDVWEMDKFLASRLVSQPFTDEDAAMLSQYGI